MENYLLIVPKNFKVCKSKEDIYRVKNSFKL